MRSDPTLPASVPRIVFSSVLTLLSLGFPMAAQPVAQPAHPWCGSGQDLLPQLVEIHRRGVDRPVAGPRRGVPKDRDLGEIAILEDDGTLLGGTTRTFAIVQRFYETHPDAWDTLVIFNNAEQAAEFGIAFHLAVQGLVGGINNESLDSPDFPTGGHPTFNFTEIIGIETRNLEGVVNMSHLGVYDGPDDPDNILGIPFRYVLAHEISHEFGAFLPASNADVLGAGNSHWSFFYDSEASVLEGNRFQDNGDGSFTTIERFLNLSQMDLYCWGLLAPEEVTYPGFVVTDPDPSIPDGSFPQVGLTFDGTRVDVGITNFVAANGPRLPAAGEAPDHFRYAFILVVAQGTDPSVADLDEVNAFRSFWENFLPAQTGGRATLDTTLTTPRFEAEFQEGLAPFEARFVNRSYGETHSYLWDFGDGQSSTEEAPTHVYQDPGVYTVSLTVTSPTATQTLTVPDFVVVGENAPLFEDFEGDVQWTVGDPADTATDGFWVRRNPRPILDPETRFCTQPDDDHTPGEGIRAFVTGNAPVGIDGASDSDDVDGGVTSVLSTVFDLSRETSATLVFHHYGYNRAMSAEDGFAVDVSPDAGQTWTRLYATAALEPRYRRKVIPLDGHIPFTASMQLRFQARDDAPANELEVVLDDVAVLTTAPGLPRDCDLAVVAAGIDYDPLVPGVQSGPGLTGQAVAVLATLTNDGLLPATEAVIAATAVVDASPVERALTIHDFDPATSGDQELAPAATVTVEIPFEPLALDRCGTHEVEVRHLPAFLHCRDGEEVIVGDEDPSDDGDSSPPIDLDMGVITLDLRPESLIIESASTEKLHIDAAIQGAVGGLPPIAGLFRFDVVSADDPPSVVFADARPPHPRTVATDIDRMATIRVGLDVSPSLPLQIPLRVRVTMTDTDTGEECAVGLSGPFTITGG